MSPTTPVRRRAGARRLEPGEVWERQLAELLALTGWTYVHTRPAYVPGRRAPITPMHGSGMPGWPDFTAHKPGRFLVAEAKAGGASLEPAQRQRLRDIDAGGVIEAYLFHARDLEAIRAVLQQAQPPGPFWDAIERDDQGEPVTALWRQGYSIPRTLQPWRYRRSPLDGPAPGTDEARVRG